MILFYAITNLHLLNIVNTKLAYFQNEDADLYIADSNRISPSLVANINETKLFRKVVLIPSIIRKDIPDVARSSPALRLIFLIINNIIESLAMVIRLHKLMENTKYSRIFINNFNIDIGLMINYVAARNNNNIRISIVEEGCGLLYQNKDDVYRMSTRFSVIYLYLRLITQSPMGKEKYIACVDEIYLYAPSIYSSDTYLPSKKLPIINSHNEIVKKLLDLEVRFLDISEYIQRKCYYFASAEVVTDNYNVVNTQLDALLTVIPKGQILIKDHPRFTSAGGNNAYAKYQPDVYVDQRNYLLESLYCQLDLSEKVFITSGSATVLHPKYMFGKEPYVIFTYNMNKSINSAFNEKVAMDLKSLYINKSKILVPNTIFEMQDMISRILQRQE